jgi:hypothetical protein
MIGPPTIILIILAFINPVLACAGILLLFPAQYLLESGYAKWDAADFAGF